MAPPQIQQNNHFHFPASVLAIIVGFIFLLVAWVFINPVFGIGWAILATIVGVLLLIAGFWRLFS